MKDRAARYLVLAGLVIGLVLYYRYVRSTGTLIVGPDVPDMNPTIGGPEPVKVKYRQPFSPDELKNGDIVVYREAGTDHTKISRVIALAGDLFRVENQKVYVNGGEAQDSSLSQADVFAIAEYRIPSDHVVLIPDNRNGMGCEVVRPVPLRRIVGIVQTEAPGNAGGG